MKFLDFIKKTFGKKIDEEPKNESQLVHQKIENYKQPKPKANNSNYDNYIFKKPGRYANLKLDGLYPEEILMISYAPKYSTVTNEFQGFWKYSYGIVDCKQLLEKLLDNGYLKFGDVSDSIRAQRISDIKPVLKKYNLKVSGKKAELVDRLIENVSSQKLSVDFPIKYYRVSEKGMELLNKYPWISYIHRNNYSDIDIWSFSKLMQGKKEDYKEVLYQTLDQIAEKYYLKEDYGFFTNTKLNMVKVLIDQGKFESALFQLLVVIANDLNGSDLIVGNQVDIKSFYFDHKKYIFPYSDTDDSKIKIPPAVITLLEDILGKLDLSGNETYSLLLKGFEEAKVPIKLFQAVDMTDIAVAEMKKDIKKLKSIYSSVEKRLDRM